MKDNVISLLERKKNAAQPKKPAEQGSDATAQRLMQIADELDAVILRHLNEGLVDPQDVAGVMSHRLGTLMRHIEGKSVLWGVCERVVRKQADLEESV